MVYLHHPRHAATMHPSKVHVQGERATIMEVATVGIEMATIMEVATVGIEMATSVKHAQVARCMTLVCAKHRCCASVQILLVDISQLMGMATHMSCHSLGCYLQQCMADQYQFVHCYAI